MNTLTRRDLRQMRDFRQAGNRRDQTHFDTSGREAARSDRPGAADSSLKEPVGTSAPEQSCLSPRFSLCRDDYNQIGFQMYHIKVSTSFV